MRREFRTRKDPMKLVIAEKPMLARAIAAAIDGKEEKNNGYVIKGDYVIISAFGHLLTLKEPEDYDAQKYKKWTMEALPIYFENWGKKPGEGKEERLNLIGDLLKKADMVIHAGDPDDEGQYLIDEILQWFDYHGPVMRLATGDTTEGALRKALGSMKDNKDCVNAGWSAHARSVADIMVGYNFSRYFSLLNSHVKMLTVGRVQTPTLGLVVTRDMAIENHARQCFYVVRGQVELDGHKVDVKFEPAADDPNLEEGKITDKDYAEELTASLQGIPLEDIRVNAKDIVEQPPLPFNLVHLQTYCSNKFGYDPSKTLAITQSLRDNHNAITYNRSDCQYLSEEQYKEAPATMRQVLENLKNDQAGKVFGKLPLNPKLHSKAFNDKNISAHTAIIPQNRRFDLAKLTEEERNVYLAIVKYFMAQFLPPAQKKRTNLEAPVENGMLKASSTEVIAPGYMALIKPEKKQAAASTDPQADSAFHDIPEEDEQTDLSLIAPGSYIGKCVRATCEEKETKAPPRYTKASLNEDMTRIARYVTDPEAKRLLLAKDKEKKGENGSIGTSATRASIIDNLELRGFIKTKGKQIISTQLGRELYRILPDQLKKPDMTGLWWAVQESIQEGQVPWTTLTDSVMNMIRQVLKTSYPKVDAYHVPEEMRRGKLLLGSCPRCGCDVIEGKNGFGCSGYKDGCKFVIWKTAKSGMMSKTDVTADMVHQLLTSFWTDEVRENADGEKKPTGRQRTEATILVKRLYSENKKMTYPGLVYLCDEGPSSEYGASFGLQEIVREAPVSLGKCPRCGGDVIEGKNGYGCNGFKVGCKFVIWKKAKFGIMSKTTATRGTVKKLLKSNWVPMDGRNRLHAEDNNQSPAEADCRLRTEVSVPVKRLWNEDRQRIFSGEVFLYDDGNTEKGKYGASFGLERVTYDGPEQLGICPRCGKPVIEGRLGFGCSGFRDGCKFTIWKNGKQKLLANVTFTKADAKKFLADKMVTKGKLVDKKGRLFKAALVMVEEADNPFGPVFRVVDGTIEPEEGIATDIQIEVVAPPEKA